MKLITESVLKELLKSGKLDGLTEYRVMSDVIVTPLARAWLMDRKITLLVSDKKQEEAAKSVLPAFHKPDHYTSLDGTYYTDKPEHMTALHGNLLVAKDHPRIVLRGKIDSLEARVVQAQIVFGRLKLIKGVKALEEVLAYIKEILRCEVLNLPLELKPLFGISLEELRERSHHPEKYYGVPHVAVSAKEGEAVVLLNVLRTTSREAELAAYAAFKGNRGRPDREDIITAFNRLSSIFYEMMFEMRTGGYADEDQ